MKKTVLVKRSSKGLRDMLFDELDKLRNGQVNPSRLNVIAKTASQIISTARLEMDFYRLGSSMGIQKTEAPMIPPIELG